MLERLLIFVLLIMTVMLFYHYSKLKDLVESKTIQLFDTWREKEANKLAESKATQLFNEWKEKEEKAIRGDAIRRSTSVILGKVGEHLTPIIMFEKHGITAKDFRFIGTPVDFIAFKGLSEGHLEEICFIEVKSGESTALTEREKQVKDIVEYRKVRWLLIHLPSEIERLK